MEPRAEGEPSAAMSPRERVRASIRNIEKAMPEIDDADSTALLIECRDKLATVWAMLDPDQPQQ